MPHVKQYEDLRGEEGQKRKKRRIIVSTLGEGEPPENVHLLGSAVVCTIIHTNLLLEKKMTVKYFIKRLLKAFLL